MPGLLLRGGTILLHTSAQEVQAVQADVLVENDIIRKIEPSISPPNGYGIIDCSNSIVSAGFVDTHTHMWETPLKGVCENLTGLSYFATMFTASASLKPQDVYWCSLAGCLESLNAGTTTILDYSHVNWTAQHGPQAMAGCITSGIRTIFAFAPSMTLKTAQLPKIEFEDLLPDWFFPSLERLSTALSSIRERSRVTLGLGFDFYFLPKDVVQGIFSRAKSLGVHLVTSHWARFGGENDLDLPGLLKSYHLDDHRVVLSHANGATQEDLATLNENEKWSMSSSPSAEMTLGMGLPVGFRDQNKNNDVSCSIGTDCHCLSSSSMVNEMRLGLMAARGFDSVRKHDEGKYPRSVWRTSIDAYLMGTIRGAQALGLADKIGSIEEGKQADLIVFDALSPAMLAAAQQDPVTAIIMHSSAADIDTVIVGGVVRKQGGKLVPMPAVAWDEGQAKFSESRSSWDWKEIARQVLAIQGRFIAKLPGFDLPKLREAISSLYGMQEVGE